MDAFHALAGFCPKEWPGRHHPVSGRHALRTRMAVGKSVHGHGMGSSTRNAASKLFTWRNMAISIYIDLYIYIYQIHNIISYDYDIIISCLFGNMSSFRPNSWGFNGFLMKTNQGGVRWVPSKFHGKAVKRRGIFPMKLGTKELVRVFPLILWMVAIACTKRMVETYK